MSRRRLIDNIKKYPTWYEVKDQVFTENNYIDTGVKLWDSAKDFTVLLSFTTETSTSQKTILHALYEVEPWKGFVIQLISGPAIGLYSVSGIAIANYSTTTKKCVVVKRIGDSYKAFSNDLYPAGILASNIETPVTNNLSVLLGAYQTTSGTKGRYWKGTIHHCVIYSEALTDEQIQELINKEMA